MLLRKNVSKLSRSCPFKKPMISFIALAAAEWKSFRTFFGKRFTMELVSTCLSLAMKNDDNMVIIIIIRTLGMLTAQLSMELRTLVIKDCKDVKIPLKVVSM